MLSSKRKCLIQMSLNFAKNKVKYFLKSQILLKKVTCNTTSSFPSAYFGVNRTVLDFGQISLISNRDERHCGQNYIDRILA